MSFLLQSQTTFNLGKCSKFLHLKIGVTITRKKIPVLPRSIDILTFHNVIS